jgi:hypothetical protein
MSGVWKKGHLQTEAHCHAEFVDKKYSEGSISHTGPYVFSGRRKTRPKLRDRIISRHWERMMEMRKWPKTVFQDLWFVHRYCCARTYPASNLRCRYAKAKLMAKSSEISTGKSEFKEVDGLFLCRYPDENMPTHEARLTSELDQCPNRERREMIDTLYTLEKKQPTLRERVRGFSPNF